MPEGQTGTYRDSTQPSGRDGRVDQQVSFSLASLQASTTCQPSPSLLSYLLTLCCTAEVCQEAKQAHAEILHIHQEEMEGLTSKPPSAWPQPVKQLVELKEKAAASSAESAAHAEAEAAEAEFEAEADRLREIATEARSRQQHAEAQM